MHSSRWVGRYRKIFFVSLTTLVALQIYAFFGQPLLDLLPSLVADVLSRALIVSWILTMASTAAILVSLAVRAYEHLEARDPALR